jgi:soluble lytic murein transglycosylase-like protein
VAELQRRAGRCTARTGTGSSVALAFLFLFCPPAAHAELWGYVDAQGAAHFATQKLDDRYQLFFRGGSSLDPPQVDPAEREARAALERSALFRRVVDHPNVKRYSPLIARYAKTHALDPALVKAMIAVESAFDPNAVSPKGAVGLMQILPDTGARYGLADGRRRTIAQQLVDPTINIRIGVRYLHDLLAMFEQDVTLALAAYNAGEQVVRQYGNRVPPFAETREYVALVQQFHMLYRPVVATPTSATRPRLVLPPRQPREPNVDRVL